MTAPACRHCGRAKVNRPRGLCWTCFYAPGVRERYSLHPHSHRRGVGHREGGRPDPTDVPPGPAKVAVLAARAAAGLALWCDDDAE